MKKILTYLMPLSLGFMPLAIAWPEGAQALMPLREQAKASYTLGQYDQAVTLYSRLLRLEPKNLDLLKEAMWAFWNMRRYQEAAVMAAKVLKIHAKDGEALNIQTWTAHALVRDKIEDLRAKAIAQYQVNNLEEAARLNEEIVELDRHSIPDLKEQMWIFWNMGRYKESVRIAHKIEALHPNDPQVLDILAQEPQALRKAKEAAIAEKLKAGRFEEAVNGYEALLKSQPDDPGPLKKLVWALYGANRLEEAKTTAVRLTVLEPRNAAAWALLAKIQMDLNQPEEALPSCLQSLALDAGQPTVRADLGKIYIRLRDIGKGIRILEPLVAHKKVPPAYIPPLAKAYFYRHDYLRSAEAWDRAVKAFPERLDYRFQAAQAYFYARSPKGLVQMERLSQTYDEPHAAEFLINNAVAQGRLAEAIRRREATITAIKREDEKKVLRLANWYNALGEADQCLNLLNRFLQVAPTHQKALMMKAGILRDQQHFAAAAQIYRQISELNPETTMALVRRADCLYSMGQWVQALQTIEKARRKEPKNPYLLMMNARYLYDAGETQASKTMLTSWLDTNTKWPTLPVLLYHGLSTFAQDPWLADETLLPLDTFIDHMRAIASAGYTPVTAEQVSDWIAGRAELPKQPILITFDDDILSSFELADPVLAKYHLKASMFIPLINVEGERPIGYASWSQVEQYRQTGRWEIEDHGNLAHLYIPTDADHNQALFLTDLQWLDPEKRLETFAEWEKRVRSDHESGKDKIQRHTGMIPSAFAYPEGEYGQNGTNDPAIVPANLALIRKSFQTAFIEDDFGMNTRTQDPALMTRLQPERNWTGEFLLQHLRDQNPVVLITQELLYEAVWEDHPREAYSWLQKLTDLNVSANTLWSSEARIRLGMGDVEEGRELASKVLSVNSPQYDEMVGSHLAKEGPAWSPEFQYQEDNHHRRNKSFDQSFALAPTGNIAWRLEHRVAQYLTDNVPTVTDNGVGLGADMKLGLYQDLSWDVMGHFLSGQADNTAAAYGSLLSGWTDYFQTTVEGGRAIYDTAQALNANVIQTHAGLSGYWTGDGNWSATSRFRVAHLSDGNRRLIVQPEIARSFLWGRNLKLVYRFTYDDMKDDSPDYYSPQHLLLHEFGPEYRENFNNRCELFIRYRPGYGSEKVAASEFVQQVETYLQVKVGEKTWITPLFTWDQTPSYHEQTYQLQFRHHFGELKNLGVPIHRENDDLDK